MNKKTKKRIRNLERRTAYLADMLDITAEHQSDNLTEFESIKQRLAYLEGGGTPLHRTARAKQDDANANDCPISGMAGSYPAWRAEHTVSIPVRHDDGNDVA